MYLRDAIKIPVFSGSRGRPEIPSLCPVIIFILLAEFKHRPAEAQWGAGPVVMMTRVSVVLPCLDNRHVTRGMWPVVRWSLGGVIGVIRPGAQDKGWSI